ncbi:MAG TPA: preprotein translocase subunit YajC [Trebonia sp.]|jgi:preprotein translocase subunit YajC|nr:preprotein translocase subunit YajC [Trebonia sp.]
MGTTHYLAAAAATKSGGSGSFSYILIIVVIFAAFYFLMIRPQQRRRQQAAQKQNDVSPGARVRTTAGMYATVVEVDGDDVLLEVAPGIEVRYMKRAIMDVVEPGEPAEEEYAAEEPEDIAEEPAEPEHEDTTVVPAVHEPEAAVASEAGDADAESAYEKATGSKND